MPEGDGADSPTRAQAKPARSGSPKSIIWLFFQKKGLFYPMMSAFNLILVHYLAAQQPNSN